LQEVIDDGVRRAYLLPENKLRASILADPAFTRVNTRDNTPSVCISKWCPATRVSFDVAAKGGGSENKTKFKMMNPVRQYRRLGAGDDPANGRWLVPAGDAGHRHWRHGGKGRWCSPRKA
jgi:tartrate dehydratase alpha subunit/fumarate hydratase class I-like protein